MAAMSAYLESQVLMHLFRTGTFTKPTTLAVALCTVTPTAQQTGTLTGYEVWNSGAYARVTLGPLDASWASPTTTGITSNAVAITFGAASGTDWSTITSVAITDNGSYGGGDLLFWGTLTGNKVVSNGDTFQFAIGQLSVQLT
jgi:hypothetical protein